MRRFDTPLDLQVAVEDLSFWVEVKERISAVHHGKRSPDARPARWDRYPLNRERIHWLTPAQRNFVVEYPAAWCVVVEAAEVVAFHNWLICEPIF